ncbi:MAG TPA: thiamine phosphate synthase [Candidatus Omnitrophota bacterium]|nr:thiamine phosphate synthase [Candidatus Omnitrophota bacterium]
MKSVYRIIDANINRAMEGMRVIEEIARFHLDDDRLAKAAKALRARFKSAIAVIPRQELLAARSVATDVGAVSYTRSESERNTIEAIFYPNIKRAEESMRVLEEFSKLAAPSLGMRFKAVRFRLYELEKEIGRRLALDFKLYVITDPSRDPIETIKKIGRAGVRIVQLRDKYSAPAALLKIARKAKALTRKLGIKLIINDRIDVAKRSDADGVHVGQGDGSVKAARKALGEGKIVGASANTVKEAQLAEKQGADYIGFGPVFASPTKPGVKPLGLSALKKVIDSVDIPVVALGGIYKGNIGRVQHYTDKVAVINAVVGEKDMERAAAELLKSAGEDRID